MKNVEYNKNFIDLSKIRKTSEKNQQGGFLESDVKNR